MKADEKFLAGSEKQKFTNFEYVEASMRSIQEAVEEIQLILRENDLFSCKRQDATHDISENIFLILDEEEQDKQMKLEVEKKEAEK